MQFDSVYILAFDGWLTELRSNRWHYASRWARKAPVVIVQPRQAEDWEDPEAIPDGRLPGVEVLRIAADWNPPAHFRRNARIASDIATHMTARGHAAPLIWAYDPRLAATMGMLPAAARVFHATENYLDFEGLADDFAGLVQASLGTADLVVAVSNGVAAAYRPYASGDVLVATNGCDYTAFSQAEPDAELATMAQGWARVGIYGGNINGRIDFDLVSRVASGNPDMLVALYGPIGGLAKGDEERVAALRAMPNVVLPGPVDPDRLPGLYKAADLGLIPYRLDRFIVENGFPLKAFEMVAAGLPVVSSFMRPMLAYGAPWFVVSGNEDEFLSGVAALSRRSLSDKDCSAMDAAARAQDYDGKFDLVFRAVEGIVAARVRQTADLSQFYTQVGYLWGPDKTRVEVVEVVKTRFSSTREALLTAYQILINALYRRRPNA